MAISAEELTFEALGEAVLELLRQRRPDVEQQARRAIAFAREVTEPPAGAQLITDDGAEYSGLAVVHRSEVTALLGVRHRPACTTYGRPSRRSPHLVPADYPGVEDGWDHLSP